MNRSQLISKVAENTGLTPAMVELVLAQTQEVIACNLAKGERTVLPNFGRFELMSRKRRSAADPVLRQIPGFTPSSELKKRVNSQQD